MEDETLTAKAEKFKNKGNDEFKLGNYQNAIEYYSQAIETQPNEPAFFTNRAIAYLKIQEFEQAMNDCQRAIAINEKFAKAYNRMSKCFIAMGELSQASIALAKSMELEPGNDVNKKDQKHLDSLKITESLVNKALREELYEKAVTNLTQLLEDCVRSVKFINLKIQCLMKAYKFEEASTYSAQVMKLSTNLANNPQLLCSRGKVLIYTGADVIGKKHLTQAMNFDPDLKECQQVIKMLKKAQTMKDEAAVIFKDGKYEEAIVKFEECMQLDELNANYNSTILLNIAICYSKLNKNDLALKALNKAILYNPKYAKAYVKRGEIHLQLEEYNEAIKDFNEASEHDSTGFNVQAKLKDAQDKAKKAKRKDYYKILDVPKTATEADIKKAYKKAALKWHPDKNSQTEEDRVKAEKMFKDINEANAVLTDKDKKDKYDQGYDLEDIQSGKANMGGFGGIDPHDIMQMFMSQGMGGMGGMGGGRRGTGSQRGGHPGFTFRFG